MWVSGLEITKVEFPFIYYTTVDKLLAYSLSTGARLPGRDIPLDSENTELTGIWSDGIIMWVADHADDKLYAYNLASGQRVTGRDIPLHADNFFAAGITSDGSTMWVGQGLKKNVFAYDLETKARQTARELSLEADNISSEFWTDGFTIWVTDTRETDSRDRVRAYDLSTKARAADKDFVLEPENGVPSSIWSDGVTMWVSDAVDKKLYAYADAYLPGASELAASAEQAVLSVLVGYRFGSGPTANVKGHLRYRHAALGGGSPGTWVKASPVALSNGRAEFMLTGLSPDTRYDVEVSLDSLFPGYATESFTFSTTPLPAVSGFRIADVNAYRAQGTALADLYGSGIAEQVHLRYRARGEDGGSPGPWVEITPVTTTGGSVPLELTGLSPATIYEVQVSLDSDFPADATQSTDFATDGVVLEVSVPEVTPHLALATVSVRRGPNQPVAGAYLRVRPAAEGRRGPGDWVVIQLVARVVDQVALELRRLSPATAYEVEASLDAAFPADETQYASFTTADGVSSIDLADVMPYQASATVRSAISARVGDEEIYLRYRTVAVDDVSPGDWFTVAAERSADDFRFNLTGLSPSTRYEVEASLSRAFRPGFTLPVEFTTIADGPDAAPTANDVDEITGFPFGIWSDGVTMWVSGGGAHLLWAYDLVTQAYRPAGNFRLVPNNTNPHGIWSDGVTLWALDGTDRKLYAYNLATQARESAKDIDLTHRFGGFPINAWSDGVTIWVPVEGDKVYAYNLATRARDADKDIALDNSNGDPTGIWSDGATLWVADSSDVKVYAYNRATQARDADKDIVLHDSSQYPASIWSDGFIMWVADGFNTELRRYPVAGKTVANSQPLGVIDGIAGGDGTINVAEHKAGVEIFGKASPGAAVTVRVGDHVVGSATAGSTIGYWSVTAPAGAPYVSEGTVTFTMVVDKDGEQFTATRDFAVDLTPPTLTMIDTTFGTNAGVHVITMQGSETGRLGFRGTCGVTAPATITEANAPTTLTYPALVDDNYRGCSVTLHDLAGNPGITKVHSSHWDVTVDTQAPTLVSASDAGLGDVLLRFSEGLDWNKVPRPGAFTVKVDGAAGPAVEWVSVGGQDYRLVTLELAASLPAQGTVTLDYDHRASEDPFVRIGPLRDEAGNLFLSVTDYPVSLYQEDYGKLGPGKPSQ